MSPEQIAKECDLSLGEYLETIVELTPIGLVAFTQDSCLYLPDMVDQELKRKQAQKHGHKGWTIRRKKDPPSRVPYRVPLYPHDNEHGVGVVVVREGIESAERKGRDQPVQPYKLKDDPASRVIYAYKIVKGFQLEDREWDGRQWARNVNPAKEIVAIFNGDLDAAIDYVRAFADNYAKKKLSYTLETMVRGYDEWRLELGKLQSKV